MSGTWCGEALNQWGLLADVLRTYPAEVRDIRLRPEA
jgi:hypothetical protein